MTNIYEQKCGETSKNLRSQESLSNRDCSYSSLNAIKLCSEEQLGITREEQVMRRSVVFQIRMR